MPALPDNLTQRLFLQYTSRQVPHVACFRFGTPLSPADLSSAASGIASNLANIMLNDDSIYGANYASVGSDVHFPLTFAAFPGVRTLAGNVWTQDPESVQLSMTGKSTGAGTRWSTRFFTAYNNGSPVWPAKNRLLGDGLAGDYLAYYQYIQSLVNSGSGVVPRIYAADSSTIIANGYLNFCSNGYWQRKQRRS